MTGDFTIYEQLKNTINSEVLDLIDSLTKRIDSLENTNTTKEIWLSKSEVAKHYQVSERTIYRNMQSGDYKWRKPKGGSRQILKSSIIEATNLK